MEDHGTHRVLSHQDHQGWWYLLLESSVLTLTLSPVPSAMSSHTSYSSKKLIKPLHVYENKRKHTCMPLYLHDKKTKHPGMGEHPPSPRSSVKPSSRQKFHLRDTQSPSPHRGSGLASGQNLSSLS